MKNRLLEKDYKKIFKPETLALLKGKAKDNLARALGDKSLEQVVQDLPRLSKQVAQAEEGYRDELEMLAKQIVTDVYPIIDLANIAIDAKIVSTSEIGDARRARPNEEDPTEPDFGQDNPDELKAKRRIINAITQGGALRGTEAFLLFKDYLDQIDPTLVDKYKQLQRTSDALLDDEGMIAFIMSQLAQGRHMGQGGEASIYYNDEDDQFVIRARAINFPLLVHEIIKGLYQIVGTSGTTGNDPQMKAIHKAVDRPEHEPEDLQMGKFIYDAINKIYIDSKIDNPAVRDYFLDELYRLDTKKFFSFIENAIHDKLTPEQKRWAEKTMKDIEDDIT